jgi:hypothetical protein
MVPDLSSVASASISADSSNQISARARALACEALFDTDDEFSIAEVVLKCLLKVSAQVVISINEFKPTQSSIHALISAVRTFAPPSPSG